MKLISILKRITYGQRLQIYTRNAYDQNIHVGTGTKMFLLDSYEGEDITDYLTYKVMIMCGKMDGTIMVILKSKNYNTPLEEIYPKSYVEKWVKKDKSTRPYVFSAEIE